MALINDDIRIVGVVLRGKLRSPVGEEILKALKWKTPGTKIKPLGEYVKSEDEDEMSSRLPLIDVTARFQLLVSER